jgi:hypothetical protein
MKRVTRKTKKNQGGDQQDGLQVEVAINLHRQRVLLHPVAAADVVAWLGVGGFFSVWDLYYRPNLAVAGPWGHQDTLALAFASSAGAAQRECARPCEKLARVAYALACALAAAACKMQPLARENRQKQRRRRRRLEQRGPCACGTRRWRTESVLRSASSLLGENV